MSPRCPLFVLVIALAACQPAEISHTGSSQASSVVATESDYLALSDQAGLLALYYAQSGQPIPYDAFAELLSEQYRNTSNSFKRQALLETLSPQIDALVAQRQAKPCFTLKVRLQLGHFDLQQRQFPLSGLEADTQFAFLPGGVAITQASPPIRAYRPHDEAMAHRIEEHISQNGAAYAYPATTWWCSSGVTQQQGRKLLQARLLRIQIHDVLAAPIEILP